MDLQFWQNSEISEAILGPQDLVFPPYPFLETVKYVVSLSFQVNIGCYAAINRIFISAIGEIRIVFLLYFKSNLVKTFNNALHDVVKLDVMFD